MDYSEFVKRLMVATSKCLEFTRPMILQSLPDQVRYRVRPNSSYDGNPLIEDEQVYPDDSLGAGGILGPWTLDLAAKYLWRDGKIPEWIDLSVVAEDNDYSYIELLCCGRYTAQDKLLYHRNTDHSPMLVKSPDFPLGWRSPEESGQFDLYWIHWRAGGNPYLREYAQALISGCENEVGGE